MKLKITVPNSNSLTGAKVYLDDKEVQGITRVNVNLAVGEVNSASIEFIPTSIEIEGDFEVVAKYLQLKCRG